MKAIILMSILVGTNALAGEVLSARGLANAKLGSRHVEALLFEAKASAIDKLPPSHYKQISDWQSNVVTVNYQTFVSARADFEINP